MVCSQKSSSCAEESVPQLFLITALKQSVGNQGIWISEVLSLYLGDDSGLTMLALCLGAPHGEQGSSYDGILGLQWDLVCAEEKNHKATSDSLKGNC